jgi:hypothetical protein
MFLRFKDWWKDGKQHGSWSVVENTRVAGCRVMQRHVLYLGEINDPPVHYLVGTPKGRLTRLEKHLIAKPWQEARPGVQVKLLAQDNDLPNRRS